MGEAFTGLSEEAFAEHLSASHTLADGLNLAPYKAVPVIETLKEIRALVPDAQCLRTDRLMITPTRKCPKPARVIFESRESKPFITFTPQESGPGLDRVLKHVSIVSGLDAAGAQSLQEMCRKLIEINPLGAWTLYPAKMEDLVVTEEALGARPLGQDELLRQIVRNLADLLPEVHQINIRHQNRGKRRKQWCQFEDANRREMTSIDSSAFAIHAKSFVARPDVNLVELNLMRLVIWSRQLKCSVGDLVEVFHELIFLTAVVGATRIVLR